MSLLQARSFILVLLLLLLHTEVTLPDNCLYKCGNRGDCQVNKMYHQICQVSHVHIYFSLCYARHTRIFIWQVKYIYKKSDLICIAVQQYIWHVWYVYKHICLVCHRVLKKHMIQGGLMSFHEGLVFVLRRIGMQLKEGNFFK